jgi:hypothetical protein
MLTDLPLVPGYEVTEHGVFRIGRRRVRVSWRAFGVVGACFEDGEHVVEVAFDSLSGWRRMTVPRLTVATWKVMRLAAFGFPVDSTTAREVIRYLAASEAALLAARRGSD